MKSSKTLDLRFTDQSGTTEKTVSIDNLVIAGWTGRNTEAVEAHIADLAALGVKRPKKTPCFYRASVDQLTIAGAIQVIGTESSGEVEFFLLSLDDGLWVGVGSDHTDRKVEAYDVTVSKQMCAKPISSELWAYEEIRDHWDQLILRSSIDENEGEDRQAYQEGAVANMLAPEVLVAMYTGASKTLAPGTLMYCGTLAVMGGVRPAQAFAAELFDPVADRRIVCEYQIIALPREE